MEASIEASSKAKIEATLETSIEARIEASIEASIQGRQGASKRGIGASKHRSNHDPAEQWKQLKTIHGLSNQSTQSETRVDQAIDWAINLIHHSGNQASK